jgi:hypothetical protein
MLHGKQKFLLFAIHSKHQDFQLGKVPAQFPNSLIVGDCFWQRIAENHVGLGRYRYEGNLFGGATSPNNLEVAISDQETHKNVP